MFNNTSIKSVLIIIAVLLFLGTTLFTFSLWNNFQAIHSALNAEKQEQEVSDLLTQARYDVVQIQQFLTDVGATHESSGFADAKKHLDSALNALNEVAQREPGHQAQIEGLKQKITAMHEAGVAMGWAYIKEGNEAGNAVMKALGNGLDDTSMVLSNDLKALLAQQDNELNGARARLSNTLNADTVSSVSACVGLLLFVVLSLALLYQKILPPLLRLNTALETLQQGGGDLTRRIPHAGNDEIGGIIKHFNGFLSMLQDMLRQVATETQQVSAASHRLSEMSKQVQQELQKQSISTDQVATTVTQLSATVTDVASNTNNAAGNAQKSRVAAQSGKAVVSNTVHSIHALSSNIDRVSSVIGNVENDCKSVSTVLDVIQSIADQTNLLALNAAIEAARAGEQGRGFAVVADEVRTLASRTQASTHEIQAMIERLQNGSREAVDAMADSEAQAKETVNVIESTGVLLDNIAGMVDDIAGMNSQISVAVKEQKTVVEHINHNVIAISDASIRNFQSVQQATQEAFNLEAVASKLQGNISKFKL